MRLFWLLVSSLSLLFSSPYFLIDAQGRDFSPIDTMPKADIADMHTLPQEIGYYAKSLKPLSDTTQQRAVEAFKRAYFKPWKLHHLTIDPNDFQWEIRFVQKAPIYTQDAKPIPAKVYQAWIANEAYTSRNTIHRYAIAIRHTDLKAFPSFTPFYRDPHQTGEGFPFDYNQNSALHLHTPLFVSHYSRDKKWAFVEASYAFGWVKREDIRLLTPTMCQKLRQMRYGVAIKDNLRISTSTHHFYSLVKLGTLFPLNPQTNQPMLISQMPHSRDYLFNIKVTLKEAIAPFPLPFTAQNVTRTLTQLYNEPYGWGEGFGCRDCSATTRDFLGLFGFFLRRNSSQQYQDGKKTPLPKTSKTRRKAFIIKHALPFRSLLYTKGHIALYLGAYHQEPVIFHTYWGIRQKDGSKYITARTIISSTEPAKEKKETKERSKLIHTLQTIVTF